MSTINKNNYYVVQFKDLPYDDIEKYIIIPYSWIRIRRPSGTIQVAFPKEDPKKTRKRVKENKKYGQNWQLYEVVVKFDSNTFDGADNWISTMNNEQCGRLVIAEEKINDSSDKSKMNKMTTNEDSTMKTNKSIVLLPKKRHRITNEQKTSFTTKVDKPEIKVKPFISDKNELIKKSLKRKIAVNSRTEFLIKKANIANKVKSAEDGSNCGYTSEKPLDDRFPTEAEHSDKELLPQNTVVNLCTTKNTKSNGSPTQLLMSPQNVSQRHVPVASVENFRPDYKNTHSETRIDASDAMEALRILKLKALKRSSHHASESRFAVTNSCHSHEVPQRQETPTERLSPNRVIRPSPVLQDPPSINIPESTVSSLPAPMVQHAAEALDAQQERRSPIQTPHSQTVVTTPPRLSEDHRESPRSTTSPVQYPKVEDQAIRQWPEFRTVPPSYLAVPHSQIFLSGGFREKTHLQGVTKNRPPPVHYLPNQLQASPTLKPIVRGFLIQDPTSGVLFLRKSNNFPEPKTENDQDTTVNSSCAGQNPPTSGGRVTSGYTDYVLPKRNGEKRISNWRTITDRSICTLNNTVCGQLNPTVHHCCSCKCFAEKQTSPPVLSQSCQHVPKEQDSDASKSSSDQEMLTEELSVKKPKDSNQNENSDGSKCDPQPVSFEQKLPFTTEISVESKEMAEKMVMNEFFALFEKFEITLANKHETITTLRGAFQEYLKTFKTIVNGVNNYCETRMKEIIEINKQPTQQATSSPPEVTTVTKKDSPQSSNNENKDDENNKATKKRSFTLPPEYDRNDTRWTLVHRKPLSGVVELIPQSNVYISAHRFVYCKRVARDCKTLACLLLTEIFTTNALRVCSLTGARAKVFDLDGSDIRPGLDEHAIMVLLTFVEEYGIRNHWCVYDTQSILNSIHSKIQEIRAKYGPVVQ